MKILSLAIYLVSVSSTIIRLETHPSGFIGINVSRVPPQDPSDMEMARFGIVLTHDEEWVPLIHSLDDTMDQLRRPIRGNLTITTVDGQHITVPSFLNQLCVSLLIYIPAHFHSDFARNFASHYLMVPMHRQLVISPPNPEDFTHGRRLMTTTSTSEDYPQVGVSVSLLNSNQGGAFFPTASSIFTTCIHDFGIKSLSLEDSIPASIVQALYDDLRQRQISIDSVRALDGTISSFDIIGDLPDEILDTFPSVQFRIHGDSGQDAIIQLDGRDYIAPFNDNRRQLLFHAGDLHFFGLNTLSKVALFIDNVNRRIGFGDPL